ncbi:diphthine synthase [Candidatus Woesearchaeota archaeon B3_Woes]|nr:MAG: diphthine synthase [Candidatus Woesearchaeota archaeon B3_Woes]
MTLNIIGIGLGDEKDITLKGLELVKKSDLIYLEKYTSKLNCDLSKLEELYGKKIILANRELVECQETKFPEHDRKSGFPTNKNEIIENSKNKEVAFLVIGDVFGATTHIDILQRAKKEGIKVNIVHNTSILNAVSETGLSLYNFGKVTSIPFENKDVVSPIKVLEDNQKSGLHTLFLLDLKPDEEKFMSVNTAIEYLIKNKIDANTLSIACCGLGSEKQIIKAGKLKDLKEKKFNIYPQCLIIPGKLHFIEEEYLKLFI